MNKGPPVFSSVPDNINLVPNIPATYTFPSTYDPDGDLFTKSINFGGADSFTTQNSNKLVFNPKLANIGSYRISVTLTDTNKTPRSTDYLITVIVIPVDGTKLDPGKNQNNETVEQKPEEVIVVLPLTAKILSVND